jgi:hypothetical protein
MMGVMSALIFRGWKHKHPDPPADSPARLRQIFAVIGVVSISFALLYRLDSDVLSPLVWEATVILSYVLEMQTLNLPNALGGRLLWAQGLLSEGDRSLLYGLPTLYLLSFQSSLESLRIFSAIYFLGAALCVYSLCRRFLTPTIATVALFTFGLCELGLIFGRYGSSIAATLFAVTLALYACASLVSHPSVRGALVALLSLYIATLGYAPGRVVVLILIGMTILGIATKSMTRLSSRISVTLVFCAGITAVCAAQHHFDHFRAYAYVRGEQISTMFSTGYWPAPLRDQGLSFKEEHRRPDLRDYASFGRILLSTVTLPQLSHLLSPFDQASPSNQHFSFDPLSLELYAKPLYPFLLVGLVMTSRYTSGWMSATLLVWGVLGCAPVLFTNRVDSYRLSMLLIPLSVWVAVGIAEALNEARRVAIPRPITCGILLGAILSVTAYRGGSLHHAPAPLSATALVIENLEPRFIENATIGVEGAGFRTLALVKLMLLRREQQGMAAPTSIIPAAQYQALMGRESAEARENAFEALVQDLNDNKPVIIGPYEPMRPILEELSGRGFNVHRIRTHERSFAFVVKD